MGGLLCPRVTARERSDPGHVRGAAASPGKRECSARRAPKIAVPGVSGRGRRTSRPRPGRGPRATRARAGCRGRSRARRAGPPSRRGCGGARRTRPRRSRRRPRRTACGPSRTGCASRPASPGSSGNIHRVGWVIENANRPPGRSTRAASATASAMSATNCSAPKEQKTTSKEASANGSWVAVPSTEGTDDAGVLVDAAASAGAGACERSRPTGRPPWAPHPARALPGAGADLEHVAAGDVAEDAQVGLGVPLGAPHEADVAEELAVRGLVLVGVAVPVRAVGPPRLGLVDRAPLDAYARVDGSCASRGTLAVRRSPASVRRLDRSLPHARRLDGCARGLPGFPDGADTARYRVRLSCGAPSVVKQDFCACPHDICPPKESFPL